MSDSAIIAERSDGPALVAFWGADEPDSDFRLGTFEFDWHRHVRGQFFCIESGLARIRTPAGSWLLPPHFAGWIPPGVLHEVAVTGALSGWGVMLTPTASSILPDEPCVVGVSELLRALVRRAATWHHLDNLSPEQERIVAVLHDEIGRSQRHPLHLPLPSDQRLLRVTRFLTDNPDNTRSLASLSQMAGLSERTARRLFVSETGMSFMQWRQQMRLILSLERLAGGEPVASVADALGYATTSAFIAVFRKTFGQPPARYFKRRQTSQDKVYGRLVLSHNS